MTEALRSLSYRNQSIDLICKSMDWFLYDRDLRHERVNPFLGQCSHFIPPEKNRKPFVF